MQRPTGKPNGVIRYNNIVQQTQKYRSQKRTNRKEYKRYRIGRRLYNNEHDDESMPLKIRFRNDDRPPNGANAVQTLRNKNILLLTRHVSRVNFYDLKRFCEN